MASKSKFEGFDEAIKKLDRMASPSGGVSSIKVGIVESATYPIEVMQGRQRRISSPTVAQVAFWNEFGTTGGGWGGPIPERPFMRDSIERFKNDPSVAELIASIIDATDPSFKRYQAEMLGNLLKGLMQEQITKGDYEPNAPATVAIKTKGKGGNTTPLIDTGLMRRSIDYEITNENTSQ